MPRLERSSTPGGGGGSGCTDSIGGICTGGGAVESGGDVGDRWREWALLDARRDWRKRLHRQHRGGLGAGKGERTHSERE
eukprot:364672-Chlamydomonas_euryale.AAC.3